MGPVQSVHRVPLGSVGCVINCGRLELGTRPAPGKSVATAKSHEDLIVWQRANELKLAVYDLVKSGPIVRDSDLRDQLRRSAAAAPRLIAEGFGRYLPGDFSRYLRAANGELKETYDALRDGVDREYFKDDEIEPLLRLSKRASKAASRLIAYLRTAKAPNEARRA
jgi:four helix bundle protein